MRVLVDGDSAGHRDYLVALAIETQVELVWVHNPSQRPPYPEPGTPIRLTTHLADAASQAADIVLMNMAVAGDIVITGDLGLASVCIAKGAAAISPRGFWYRHEDLMQRLEWRALGERLKRGGVHLDHKPPAKRLDDWRFEQELRQALSPEG